ncbi:transcriptional regulator, LacI family [Beutenbergia cavernae DSM 12333]|uniref:Transcriptional regulator, LacI family n=1 Tax=Beutenbergia cavernae (strain ATCC BAA-8 / DSM 12333 / CCUG 43141 / JCM 11478 / NBRC 16432 / NCIMB 13614 / HKI 0122) TaxID=471853 RepID=C5BUQ6_BEUC1|nr:LacI family DNA-binding transcriptional regulator [Beutenbergia cavernae]ACQ78280.1 transcriptional regulator, LacI family [Beutenbergia cavernae DSM 12333]
MTTVRPQGARRATVKEVAALAGVSPKTVSNVLNDFEGVRPQTRERVQAAMVELDFVPNLAARGLRNGRSGIIGLALPDLSTPYSAMALQHVVEAARRAGWGVQVEETGAEPSREHELVARARDRLVDGLILNPIVLERSIVRFGSDLPPVVLIGEVEDQHVDHVGVDSRAAAADVTAFLVSSGHRRILALGTAPRAEAATAHLRLEGYRDALAAAGLDEDVRLEVHVPAWSPQAAEAAVERVVADDVRFDAVFAFTDSMAIGALRALTRAGLRVPDDVSLVGFDDVPLAASLVPSLTTVAGDYDDLAATSVRFLGERVAGATVPPRTHFIAHRIVDRESTRSRL